MKVSVISALKKVMNEDEVPELIGELKKAFGLNGFEKAEIGHPVFQLRDRYILFLKSETMLVEKVYNQKSNVQETRKFFYSICVPFYIETLKPDVNLLTDKSL